MRAMCNAMFSIRLEAISNSNKKLLGAPGIATRIVLTRRNKKLVETSATLVVTGALLVVTRTLLETRSY